MYGRPRPPHRARPKERERLVPVAVTTPCSLAYRAHFCVLKRASAGSKRETSSPMGTRRSHSLGLCHVHAVNGHLYRMNHFSPPTFFHTYLVSHPSWYNR